MAHRVGGRGIRPQRINTSRSPGAKPLLLNGCHENSGGSVANLGSPRHESPPQAGLLAHVRNTVLPARTVLLLRALRVRLRLAHADPLFAHRNPRVDQLTRRTIRTRIATVSVHTDLVRTANQRVLGTGPRRLGVRHARPRRAVAHLSRCTIICGFTDSLAHSSHAQKAPGTWVAAAAPRCPRVHFARPKASANIPIGTRNRRVASDHATTIDTDPRRAALRAVLARRQANPVEACKPVVARVPRPARTQRRGWVAGRRHVGVRTGPTGATRGSRASRTGHAGRASRAPRSGRRTPRPGSRRTTAVRVAYATTVVVADHLLVVAPTTPQPHPTTRGSDDTANNKPPRHTDLLGTRPPSVFQASCQMDAPPKPDRSRQATPQPGRRAPHREPRSPTSRNQGFTPEPPPMRNRAHPAAPGPAAAPGRLTGRRTKARGSPP